MPEAAAAWRRTQGKVVFTNGVFDLLHTGHVALLEAARAEGDALIVGVNADASARRLGEGPDRPVFGDPARARHGAAVAGGEFGVGVFRTTPPAPHRPLPPHHLV